MRCEQAKLDLSLYIDAELSAADADLLEEHLAGCPLCRRVADELKYLRAGLRGMSSPEVPASVESSIRSAVALRAGVRETLTGRTFPGVSAADQARLWLMSYSLGTAASLMLGLSFLWLILASGQLPASRSRSMAERHAPAGSDAYSTRPDSVSEEYALGRRDVSSQSPSINPNGTLIGLTNLLVQGETSDDEVVVVADVYENGLAQIAEVVEPSRDKNAVDELARALDTSLSNAPFVPASYDQRSDSVRVVFRIQTVNVNIDEGPKKRKVVQRS
jgi:anti-sigma factor RsiW